MEAVVRDASDPALALEREPLFPGVAAEDGSLTLLELGDEPVERRG